jgi:hypothetical protein
VVSDAPRAPAMHCGPGPQQLPSAPAVGARGGAHVSCARMLMSRGGWQPADPAAARTSQTRPRCCRCCCCVRWGASRWIYRLRTAAAGAIVSVSALFFLLMAVGTECVWAACLRVRLGWPAQRRQTRCRRLRCAAQCMQALRTPTDISTVRLLPPTCAPVSAAAPCCLRLQLGAPQSPRRRRHRHTRPGPPRRQASRWRRRGCRRRDRARASAGCGCAPGCARGGPACLSIHTV